MFNILCKGEIALGHNTQPTCPLPFAHPDEFGMNPLIVLPFRPYACLMKHSILCKGTIALGHNTQPACPLPFAHLLLYHSILCKETIALGHYTQPTIKMCLSLFSHPG